MAKAIASIVEGDSEQESVPVLLRRILIDLGRYDLVIAVPIPRHRNGVVRPGGIEAAVRLVLQKRGSVEAILVLLDADDDCPRELGPALLERCKRVTRLPVAVVLAKKELEGWFLGAKESLRGVRGIRQDATAPADPEGVRDAKGHVTRNMEHGRRYLGVDDQPAFADKMDFGAARQRCPSFDKFLRDVQSLVKQI